MNSPLAFGKLILVARKAAGLTQEQLADLAGISKAYVGTIENARPHTVTGAISRPEREVAINLIKAINSKIDDDELKLDMGDVLNLLGYSAPPESPKNASALPDWLKPHELDGFTAEELKEIINFIGYIRYKKSQPLKDGDILNVDNGNILKKNRMKL